MRVFCLSMVWALGAAVAPVSAQAIANRYDLNIPRQSLDTALKDFAQQTGLQVARFSDAVKGGNLVGPVEGRFSVQEALATLLGPHNLSYKVVNDRTIAVVNPGDVLPDSAALPPNSGKIGDATRGLTEKTSRAQLEDNFHLASVPADDDQQGPSKSAAGATKAAEPDESEVVVTGTSLRGIAPDSSPVIVYTRKEIEASGHSTVEQFMRQIPQNFGGGVSQENYGVSGSGTPTNTQGAGVNLRGLGQRATLVLVNGRRQAPTGQLADFVDISLIPLSAVERIEILTNGASAIYGSDAVGGVVNYILRDTFEGLESVVGVGTATKGDGDQLTVAQTAGKRWESGHAMLSYEYRSEDRVVAGDRDFTINTPDDTIFTPQERRNSVFASLGQRLNDRLALNLTASYLERDTQRDYLGVTSLTRINAQADAQAKSLAGGLTYELNSNWRVQVGGTYSVSYSHSTHQTPTFLNDSRERNKVVEPGVKIDGDLFDVAGGSVKFAAGAQARFEKHNSRFQATDTSDDVLAADREVRALFSELLIPLVSALNRRAGIERLEISLAGRLEDYEDYGSSFDPKIGVVWSPVEGLSLRATYDTSFRAPLLTETTEFYNAFYYPADILYVDPNAAVGAVPMLLLGFSSGIHPETSKTWTAGVEFEPESLPGLNLTLNYFTTTFSDRIANPTTQFQIIGNPAYDSIVIRDPAVEFVQALVDASAATYDYSGPDFSDGGRVPADVTVVLDARIANTAQTKTSGFDFGLGYRFALGEQELTFSAYATSISTFENQLTPTALPVETLNTPFNPIDLRARTGLEWAHGGWNANAFVNYVDSYDDNRYIPTLPVDSFTTVDLTLAYGFDANNRLALLRNARITFSALNAFDTDPPFLSVYPGSDNDVGYDSANASGRGRYICLGLKKSW